MPVITIASTKGGVGKTTLARLLVASLAAEGADFIAVDADPNQVLSRWREQYYEGSPFEVKAEADQDRLAHLLDELQNIKPIVIVDTAGFNNQAATVALIAADLVLIPIMSDEADMMGAEATWKRVRGYEKSTRREIPAWLVINGVRKNTSVHTHVMAELDNMKSELGARWLDTKISHSVAWNELSWTGRLPTKGAGAKDMTDLLAEMRTRGLIPERPKTRKSGKKAA
jgi:chromosome partitioning protein